MAGEGIPRFSTVSRASRHWDADWVLRRETKEPDAVFAAIPILGSIESTRLTPICNKLLRRYCTYGFLSTV